LSVFADDGAELGRVLGEMCQLWCISGRTFSALYVRGHRHEGERGWALGAVSPYENAPVIEGILAHGILRLDGKREHPNRQGVAGLRLFVPARASRPLRERVPALSSGGNLESRLIPRREVEMILDASRETVARIRSLVPGASAAIETRVTPGGAELAICFRGMEFARWDKEGVSFGLGDVRKKLARGDDAEACAADTKPGTASQTRNRQIVEISFSGNSSHAHWIERKLTTWDGSDFSAATQLFR
jgi:hypothetical protein